MAFTMASLVAGWNAAVAAGARSYSPPPGTYSITEVGVFAGSHGTSFICQPGTVFEVSADLSASTAAIFNFVPSTANGTWQYAGATENTGFSSETNVSNDSWQIRYSSSNLSSQKYYDAKLRRATEQGGSASVAYVNHWVQENFRIEGVHIRCADGVTNFNSGIRCRFLYNVTVKNCSVDGALTRAFDFGLCRSLDLEMLSVSGFDQAQLGSSYGLGVYIARCENVRGSGIVGTDNMRHLVDIECGCEGVYISGISGSNTSTEDVMCHAQNSNLIVLGITKVGYGISLGNTTWAATGGADSSILVFGDRGVKTTVPYVNWNAGATGVTIKNIKGTQFSVVPTTGYWPGTCKLYSCEFASSSVAPLNFAGPSNYRGCTRLECHSCTFADSRASSVLNFPGWDKAGGTILWRNVSYSVTGSHIAQLLATSQTIALDWENCQLSASGGGSLGFFLDARTSTQGTFRAVSNTFTSTSTSKYCTNSNQYTTGSPAKSITMSGSGNVTHLGALVPLTQ